MQTAMQTLQVLILCLTCISPRGVLGKPGDPLRSDFEGFTRDEDFDLPKFRNEHTKISLDFIQGQYLQGLMKRRDCISSLKGVVGANTAANDGTAAGERQAEMLINTICPDKSAGALLTKLSTGLSAVSPSVSALMPLMLLLLLLLMVIKPTRTVICTGLASFLLSAAKALQPDAPASQGDEKVKKS